MTAEAPVTPTAEQAHLGLAEGGKMLALAGDHFEALRHYREAMRRAAATDNPTREVFLRHYTECALESLERMGAYAEGIEYCRRAIAHYAEHPPAHALARLDLAGYYERQGALALKSGDRPAACAAFERAMAAVEPDGRPMPLSAKLLRWLRNGLRVDVRRIEAEQQQLGYFQVRPDKVQPQRALRLPDAPLAGSP